MNQRFRTRNLNLYKKDILKKSMNIRNYKLKSQLCPSKFKIYKDLISKWKCLQNRVTQYSMTY